MVVVSVNLSITNCSISAFIDGHPVTIAQASYPCLPNKNDSSFEKLAIETSPLDTYSLTRQSEIQIESILEWAFSISSKCFPGHNELIALLALPIGMASAAKSTVTYLAIKSGFTQAIARHSLVSSTAISLYSHISKGNCLVFNIDGSEVSGCLVDIDDGVFEVLGHEFCLGKDPNLFSSISSVCAIFLKRLTRGDSVFGSKLDYILLSGFISDDQADEMKKIISLVLKVNASSIYFSRNAAAIGSGIVAGVLEGTIRDFLFLDCATHSIMVHNDSDGISYEMDECMQQGEKMPAVFVMIPHGTTIPTKRSEYILLKHSGPTNLAIYDCAHQKIQSVINQPSLLYECEAIQSFSIPTDSLRSTARLLVTVDIDANSIATLALSSEGFG